MVRTPVAAARMQGYSLHDECAGLPNIPQFRVRKTMHPEWVEYERRISQIKLAQTSQGLSDSPGNPPPQLYASSYPADSGSATTTSSSTDVVHVKGYKRKDGTYVQPYTRSKPRK